MDARTAESPVKSQTMKWLQRERESGRLYDRAAVVIGIFFAAMLGFSFWVLRRGTEPGSLLSPPLIALLLVANLIPDGERRGAPDDPHELLTAFPEGLTTQEVAQLLTRGNDAPDRVEAEVAMLRLVADGAATRTPLGDDAIWKPT